MTVLRIKNRLIVREPKRRSMAGREAKLEPGDERTHAIGFMVEPACGDDRFEDRVGFAFQRPKR